MRAVSFSAWGGAWDHVRLGCDMPVVSGYSIFGHEGEQAEEVVYVNWLNMVRSGLLGLEFYTPESKSWRQVGPAASRARVTLACTRTHTWCPSPVIPTFLFCLSVLVLVPQKPLFLNLHTVSGASVTLIIMRQLILVSAHLPGQPSCFTFRWASHSAASQPPPAPPSPVGPHAGAIRHSACAAGGRRWLRHSGGVHGL